MKTRVSRGAADGQLDHAIEQDVQDLHQLRYAQEPRRVMSGFSNFAISFSIISVLTGAVILYGWALRYGGPGENGWGWPVVSLFTLCIAACMAEIASAYPTAGGLYYWASVMGNRHRLILVFARNGGVPFNEFFSHVRKTRRVPDVALGTTGVLAVYITDFAYVTARGDAFVLAWTIGTITGMSTALLYWAYGAAILLGLRSEEWRSRRVWSLGNLSRTSARISIISIVVVSVLFLWRPDNEYTFQGTIGFLVLIPLYYVGGAEIQGSPGDAC